MCWVAPSEKDTANQTLEKRLWAAADQFRANSELKAGQYSTPVLRCTVILSARTGRFVASERLRRCWQCHLARQAGRVKAAISPCQTIKYRPDPDLLIS
jgi:hypothetical protein